MSRTHITPAHYESSALRQPHRSGHAGRMAKKNPVDPNSPYGKFLRAFGRVVGERRKALQKSQAAVAGEYDQANISRIELGNQGFDSQFLFNLSCSLDVDLATLFAFTQPREIDVRAHYEILSRVEYKMMQNFRRLPNDDLRKEVEEYIEFKLASSASHKDSQKIVSLPTRDSKRRK